MNSKKHKRYYILKVSCEGIGSVIQSYEKKKDAEEAENLLLDQEQAFSDLGYEHRHQDYNSEYYIRRSRKRRSPESAFDLRECIHASDVEKLDKLTAEAQDITVDELNKKWERLFPGT